jgi:hypothetical protein
MTCLPIKGETCWFIDDSMAKASGVVAANISWRGESLTVIDVGGEEEMEIVVRPTALVANSAEAPIGFSAHDEDLHAAVADLFLTHRLSA